MTKEELLECLKNLAPKDEYGYLSDEYNNHIMADGLLLSFINDPDVTKAFNAIKKWYD